jgi:hypothetical protein
MDMPKRSKVLPELMMKAVSRHQLNSIFLAMKKRYGKVV